jgi:hypothetical protein
VVVTGLGPVGAWEFKLELNAWLWIRDTGTSVRRIIMPSATEEYVPNASCLTTIETMLRIRPNRWDRERKAETTQRNECIIKQKINNRR